MQENNCVVDGVIVEISNERVLVDVGQNWRPIKSISEITDGGEVKYKVKYYSCYANRGMRGEKDQVFHIKSSTKRNLTHL